MFHETQGSRVKRGCIRVLLVWFLNFLRVICRGHSVWGWRRTFYGVFWHPRITVIETNVAVVTFMERSELEALLPTTFSTNYVHVNTILIMASAILRGSSSKDKLNSSRITGGKSLVEIRSTYLTMWWSFLLPLYDFIIFPLWPREESCFRPKDPPN